jgi:hypothetical protein
MLHGYNVTRDLKLYMDTVMSKKNEKKTVPGLRSKKMVFTHACERNNHTCHVHRERAECSTTVFFHALS